MNIKLFLLTNYGLRIAKDYSRFAIVLMVIIIINISSLKDHLYIKIEKKEEKIGTLQIILESL